MSVGRSLLVGVGLLAGSIWIGSLVCLALVSNVARRVLDPLAMVGLFREIGRLYRLFGTGSLVVALGAGVALAGAPSGWAPRTTAVIVLGAVLLALTFVAMAQAHRMTEVRRTALTVPGDEAAVVVRRGAAVAGALRGLMGLATLGIVGLMADIIGR